jgi:hypothetical protein
MAGSFAIRQSKTILARSCEAGRLDRVSLELSVSPLMAIRVQSMDGSEIREYQLPLPKTKLEEVTRGSMVQVVDPGGGWLDPGGVWYWVVVQRRLEDGCLVGRVDAHCLLGASLRDNGTVAFHEGNIFYVWPVKVSPIFNSLWFRFFSGLISVFWGGRIKALKRLPNPNPPTLYRFSTSAV